ncbi:MAG TPA: bifunctional indole-3-glycerol-phosphate synthase TrpC/phosphoribosylanthranilate isomerase TrpF, partial [Gemmatimonadales bacterium]|nr:bifunctional indole-3-glycerol-phosphate synthase TrpC/phosphoribosylanthranilate isomerase TrpF [Gemmatimonadales bacterium]
HADAISVLTDQPWFEGSLAHLSAVSGAVDLPVLRKDFIVDPWQVFESRVHGADAILLMLSVLDDAAWRECAAAAGQAGVETLTEVHTREELDRALGLGAPVIGINNRDLGTLKVDLGVTRFLAPLVPADRVVVAESGIGSHGDISALRTLVDACLVGTVLMRESSIPPATHRLIYGETKVCGLTRPGDAQAAWQAGATFGGLIFAPESPRAVSRAQAREISGSTPLRWTGVFVNAPPREITEIAVDVGLSAVQLHGEESPELVRELRDALPPGIEVWKAVRIKDHIPSLEETGADRIVLDTWRGDRRGGTGERFDWSLLAHYRDRPRAILSGGLTPEVAAAAEATGCWGLDVNSGVEERPGIKSPERLGAFFAARRGSGRDRQG